MQLVGSGQPVDTCFCILSHDVFNKFCYFHLASALTLHTITVLYLVIVNIPHLHCCITRPVVLLIIFAGLGQVLEFMYTAKLSLSPQNVEDVLAVANFLQMQEIVNACSAYQSMANPAPSLITLDFSVGESSLQIACRLFLCRAAVNIIRIII